MIPRGKPLKRGKPPARKPTKKKAVKKVWKEARAKVEAEGKCRYCKEPGSPFQLDAAHTINQFAQDELRIGPRGGKALVVSADAVVPLCNFALNDCHLAYDRHELSLRGLLAFSELRNAAKAGKRHGVDVRRRICAREAE